MMLCNINFANDFSVVKIGRKLQSLTACGVIWWHGRQKEPGWRYTALPFCILNAKTPETKTKITF
ncbi:MAG: hypothetical protein E3K29_02375 [Candidatus Brocadia sp.]|nr:hypothetical protein [Candidatus Brocadia sp.]